MLAVRPSGHSCPVVSRLPPEMRQHASPIRVPVGKGGPQRLLDYRFRVWGYRGKTCRAELIRDSNLGGFNMEAEGSLDVVDGECRWMREGRERRGGARFPA